MPNDEFHRSYKFRFVTAVRRGAISEKFFFSDTYTIKVCTSWDLNPHCLGGRRNNHKTRISPSDKYPNFGDVTANCRHSMTGKYGLHR